MMERRAEGGATHPFGLIKNFYPERVRLSPARATVTPSGTRATLAAGLFTAAGGLLLLSFLGVPYPGLLIFPFGTSLAFSAAMANVAILALALALLALPRRIPGRKR
jgi:uncharacterized membrane protein